MRGGGEENSVLISWLCKNTKPYTYVQRHSLKLHCDFLFRFHGESYEHVSEKWHSTGSSKFLDRLSD